MQALKFLRAGRIGPFSRVAWPQPGEWLGAAPLAHGIVVGHRGRLLARVEEWTDATAREFARACAAHVASAGDGRAGRYAAEARAAAESAAADFTATTVAYIAAHAAEARSPGGFDAERSWQSLWLAERLGVAS
jgi:hypothetical protein